MDLTFVAECVERRVEDADGDWLARHTRRDPGYSGMMTNPIQLQKYLGGIDYPADKQTLINRARENGADEEVIHTLEDLPMDRFNSPNDVSEATGKL